MDLALDNTKTATINGKIAISGSKSESNRLLILQQFYPDIAIENCSTSDDTVYLIKALQNTSNTIDIGHAGSAMRFLTAYFSFQEGRDVILTGSQRMQERPIKVLVDALRELGASISYLKKEGFPPVQIKGEKNTKNKISMKATVSSQYISALLLIAPTLPNGLEIQLVGEITSFPYIQMTLSILNKIGIKTSFIGDTITVSKPKVLSLKFKTFTIEPDWSSASYFYSLVALHPKSQIELLGFKENSLQGDSALPEIYKQFGVVTEFTKNGIVLSKTNTLPNNKLVTFNMNNSPDLAQTIAVTCLGLGIDCQLSGLHTLKIKETDRLQALKYELEKLGAIVAITENSLQLKATSHIKKNCKINTYEDHRMAMSFAPLSVLVPLSIKQPEVVSKSYPDFWNDFSTICLHLAP